MKFSFYFQIIVILSCIIFLIRNKKDGKLPQLNIIFNFFYYSLFHNLYTFIAYYLYYPTEDFFFIEIGAPFGTAYGLFLYYGALKINNKMNINVKVHLIPILFWFLLYIIFFITGTYKNVGIRKIYNGCLYLFMVLSWLFYTIKLYIFLNKSDYSIKSKTILSTITYILTFTACVFISYLLTVRKNTNDFKRTLIYAAFLLCIIAVIRFYNYKKKTLTSEELSEIEEPADTEPADEQYQILLNIMESEKPFLIPKLTMGDLSKVSNIPATKLAELLAYKKHTFATFVNSYRITYAIDLLSTTDLPIEDIAYRCGFNSRSTFYKQFIRITGNHPGNYRTL